MMKPGLVLLIVSNDEVKGECSLLCQFCLVMKSRVGVVSFVR